MKLCKTNNKKKQQKKSINNQNYFHSFSEIWTKTRKVTKKLPPKPPKQYNVNNSKARTNRRNQHYGFQ